MFCSEFLPFLSGAMHRLFDLGSVAVIERKGPVNLFERERWEILGDALRRRAVLILMNYDLQRHTAASDIERIVTALNVLTRHILTWLNCNGIHQLPFG